MKINACFKATSKNTTITKLGMFTLALLLCCGLSFLQQLKLLQPQQSTQLFTSTQLSNPLFSDIAKADTTPLSSINLSAPHSTASKFENQQQSANYGEIKPLSSVAIKANDYLVKISISLDWFLTVACDRYRISGWKESGLLYKILNTLI